MKKLGKPLALVVWLFAIVAFGEWWAPDVAASATPYAGWTAIILAIIGLGIWLSSGHKSNLINEHTNL